MEFDENLIMDSLLEAQFNEAADYVQKQSQGQDTQIPDESLLKLYGWSSVALMGYFINTKN